LIHCFCLLLYHNLRPIQIRLVLQYRLIQLHQLHQLHQLQLGIIQIQMILILITKDDPYSNTAVSTNIDIDKCT
jgi:hypothetical protein